MTLRLTRIKYYLWLVLFLLMCDSLYTVAIDYGRPLPAYNPSTVQNGWLNSATIFHPDAYDYASRPYSMLLRGISPLKPNFYHNPSLTIELNMLVSWLSDATALYHGAFDPHARLPDGTQLNCELNVPPNPICLRQITPFSVYVVARYLSALLVLLNIAVVYTGGRIVFNRQVGLLAAVLVGLCPMIVQIAHYENPGATTVLVSSATLIVCLILIKRRLPSRWFYFAAGLLVGLSAAARYNAAVVGVVFLLACITQWRRQPTVVILGMAAVPVGFIIGTPGAIFEFHVFFDDVRYILFWYGSVGGGPGWTSSSALQSMYDYWRYMFLVMMGPLAIVTGSYGLLRLLRGAKTAKTNDSLWVGLAVLAYIVAYTASALSSKRLNNNLLLPMITPVALLAAYGFWALSVKRHWVRRGLVMLLAGWPIVLALYLAAMFAKPDSRMLAQAWIYAHLPRDTAVHLLGSYNVPLDPLDYPTLQTYGAQTSLDDPLWDTPIIVYSDAYPQSVLRDPSLTENPADLQNTEAMIQRLQNNWIELARFPRVYWPGQDLAPDDVSLWHQMEIVVYCNPAKCPVKPG
jgi:hypothetical protein